MKKIFQTGRWVAGVTLSAAVLVGVELGSAAPPPDRSTFANQMTVNPSTGEVLSGPSNYTNVGAHDRSGFAVSVVVNPSTGEVTGGPSQYTSVGTPDRSAYASAITVDSSTGEVTGGPAAYTNVGTPDRRPQAAAITVDSSTGELTGGPTNYATVYAADRSSYAASVSVDANTGAVTGGPSHFDPAPAAGDVAALNAAYNKGTGVLALSWGGSCLPDDSDYEVYQGLLVRPFSYNHQPISCGTGGATSSSFTPGPGNRYYLIVARNPTYEGSYGRASSGSQIPSSGSACLPQKFASACP